MGDGGYIAYVGLGANLPWCGRAPEETVRAAAAALGELGAVVAVSRLWRTAPVGPVEDQPEFVNAAAVVRTSLGPEAVLEALRGLEARFGRVRGAGVVAKGPRTLDLDLLLMEDGAGRPVVRAGEALMLPHPEMHRRGFVLGPLREVAGEAVHPETGLTVRAMWAGL